MGELGTDQARWTSYAPALRLWLTPSGPPRRLAVAGAAVTPTDAASTTEAWIQADPTNPLRLTDRFQYGLARVDRSGAPPAMTRAKWYGARPPVASSATGTGAAGSRYPDGTPPRRSPRGDRTGGAT